MREWTASLLLENWGLIYDGGALRDVIRRVGTGEQEAVDEEQLAATYVETCPGFRNALPVLRFVYVYHHRPEEFDPCLPGESLEAALKRQEWHSAVGLTRKQVGPWVHDKFLNALIDQTRVRPFTFSKQIEEYVIGREQGPRKPLRTKMA